ncbi:hypothetical protein JVU11DRAFT_9787 [Chiua virens]|nr:hypothetical protein JVU11DRAFT_9787 [Chiua virens]
MTHVFVPLATRETDRPQSDFMEALTADASLTLGWITAGLTLLEVWWANWLRRWSFEQSAKGSEVEVKFERVRFNGLQFTRLKDASAFTLCAALATHVVLVVFGAPLVTHVLETALLAFVIALLTAFTPAFVLGLPSLASDTPVIDQQTDMDKALCWTITKECN